MKTIAATFILFNLSVPAFAQDNMELLREARELMRLSEQMLNDLSCGQAVHAQLETIEKLDELLRKARRDSSTPEQVKAGPQSKAAESVRPLRLCHFASRGWNALMLPTAAAAVLDSSRNEIPPEFIEAWNEYYRTFVEEGLRREY